MEEVLALVGLLLGATLGAFISVHEATVLGCLGGMVAGMMVYISLAELLPAAYRQENAPRAITGALVFGMIIMAISLVAFQL